MNAAKTIYFWMIFSFIIMAASNAHAAVVTYTLDNVILDDNNAQMTGTFSWTFDIGDFENGVGQFTFLDIPYTSHNHTDLDGNGFHDGLFLSGSIVSSDATDVGDLSTPPETAVVAPTNTLTTYPNPFNPHTTVTYFVARPSLVRLSIHDVRGRLVTTLIDQWHSSGQYSAPWNGVGLGTGLYFVRYVTGAESRTHKAVLMR
jgi:hypothetical protein